MPVFITVRFINDLNLIRQKSHMSWLFQELCLVKRQGGEYIGVERTNNIITLIMSGITLSSNSVELTRVWCTLNIYDRGWSVEIFFIS